MNYGQRGGGASQHQQQDMSSSDDGGASPPSTDAGGFTHSSREGPLSAEEEARMKEQAEADAKRQKRLALNRKAAHESRKRKKVKFATLTKTLEDLQRENEETQEQNELLREMNRFTARREMLQAENTQLRLALLTALQNLTDEMGIRNGTANNNSTSNNNGSGNSLSMGAGNTESGTTAEGSGNK